MVPRVPVTSFSSVHFFANASRTVGVLGLKTNIFVQTATFIFVETAIVSKFPVCTGAVVGRVLDPM